MKNIFLLIGLFVSLTALRGQSFESGYIVDHKGDTLWGEVKFKLQPNLKDLEFKSSGNIQTLDVSSVSGFGITGKRVFTSTVLDSVFVESIVIGKLSLFKNGDTFILKKPNEELGFLKKEYVIVEQGGRKYERESSVWKGLLFYYVADCEQVSGKVKTLKLFDSSLRKIVLDYNKKCSSQPIIDVQENLKAKVLPGIVGGLFVRKMTELDLPDYLEENTDVDLFVGLHFVITQPRLSERLFGEINVLYYNSTRTASWSGENSFSQINIDYRFDVKRLSIPTLFGITIPTESLDLRIKAGPSFNYYISKSLFEDEVVTFGGFGTDERINFDNQPFDVDSFLSFQGGLDAIKSFEKFNLGLGLNYDFGVGLSVDRSQRGRSYISAGLIFEWKK